MRNTDFEQNEYEYSSLGQQIRTENMQNILKKNTAENKSSLSYL